MTMDPAMAIEVAAMSRHRALDEAIKRGDSDIQRFYCNSTMFITGGSGFMGKQIIEKLFRSCKISKIYILLRSKKGKTIQERLDEMLKDPVFELVRKMHPDFEKKLIPVEGDMIEIRLGISHQDWETLVDEVDVIYHIAATTRFDETLQKATLINVRGTREALLLARACTKLKSFVHISTAYAQALPCFIDQEVYEEFRPSPIPPETLISMVENVEETRLNAITTGLIADWPNTYTFTKAVAEELIRTMTDGLPICIVRPGGVFPSYREPTPGWLDTSCAGGGSGIAVGQSLGIIHAVLLDPNAKIALVPCDYVNNVIISAGKEASRSFGRDSTKIYTVSSIKRNPIFQGSIKDILQKYKANVTTPRALYYVFVIVTSKRMVFNVLTWLLHLIPAYAVEYVCLFLGKKSSLLKIYKKVYNLSNVLYAFTLHTWLFDDKNTENLYKSLSETDRTIFNFDITDIDWEEYIQIFGIGIRKYIIKDGLKGTAMANKKQKWLRILHYVLTLLYGYAIWKGLCCIRYILVAFKYIKIYKF